MNGFLKHEVLFNIVFSTNLRFTFKQTFDEICNIKEILVDMVQL